MIAPHQLSFQGCGVLGLPHNKLVQELHPGLCRMSGIQIQIQILIQILPSLGTAPSHGCDGGREGLLPRYRPSLKLGCRG